MKITKVFITFYSDRLKYEATEYDYTESKENYILDISEGSRKKENEKS